MGKAKRGLSKRINYTEVLPGPSVKVRRRVTRWMLSEERVKWESAQRKFQQDQRALHHSAVAQEAGLEVGAGLDDVDDMLDAQNVTADPSNDGFTTDDDETSLGLPDDQDRTVQDASGLDAAQRDIVSRYYHHVPRPVKRYKRSRINAVQALHCEWDAQGPSLARAYLHWKYHSSGHTGGLESSAEEMDGENAHAGHVFHVTVVDIKDTTAQRDIHQRIDEYPNVALLRVGLLGCTPTDPSVAITLPCLELYHQIRRRQSSFSIQAICKVLCALHNVTYSHTFRNQFSIAFDVYLDILRRVSQLVEKKLERDTPDWRLKHACPACSYKLTEEGDIGYDRLIAMDGNMSLKRMNRLGLTDQRTFESDYLIKPQDVDLFKDDVKSHSRVITSVGTNRNRRTLGDGTAPYGDDSTICTDNWIAAHAVSEGTIDVFEQTGGFVAACRHGFVLTFVQMIRSGELAKYGLATLKKLLDVFPNDRLCVGCDIACSFTSTIGKSSLASLAKARGLRMVLNSFHGHAHNRACQLKFHPMYEKGLGLEDLETCERVFSASNAVARLVRHSSYFHWMQFIDLHLQQWDIDKYLEISNFLYNNYKQALGIINEYTSIITDFQDTHGFTDVDFDTWRVEEDTFLKHSAQEPDEDLVKVAYIEALEKLAKANSRWGTLSTVPWQNYTPATFASKGDLPSSVLAHAQVQEAERRQTLKGLELAQNVVFDLENRLGLLESWTPAHPEYIAASEYVRNHRFLRAVNTLEGLVVARLFELSKANLMGTCYKMRKQISKAITRRSKAIYTALEEYNRLAPLQDPPRPQIAKTDIAGYALLHDFDLLRHSRHEILDKPWSKPAYREVAQHYFKVLRAKEEIDRLNVEIQRVLTWVHHEDIYLKQQAEEISKLDPALGYEVYNQYLMRSRVNNVHRIKLQAIMKLRGYSGPRWHGVPIVDTEQDNDIEVDADDTTYDEILRLGEILDMT